MISNIEWRVFAFYIILGEKIIAQITSTYVAGDDFVWCLKVFQSLQ